MISPNLPSAWEYLEVDNLAFRNCILTVTAKKDSVKIKVQGKYEYPITIDVPNDFKVINGEKISENTYKINLDDNIIEIIK